MVYVKHFDILGVDTAQIPCIELQGVPNTATVGAVGLLGIDVTSEGREVYLCTDVNGSIYTWQPLKDGKDGACVVKAEVDSNGELILTLSDGKVINAGSIQGEPGQDGADGRDGDDGVSVVGTELNADGELIITLSNGTVTNVGKVVGGDGVSIVKVEMNASGELLVTLSNDTVINVGIITLQDLVGTEPIGKYTERMYYDGEKFVGADPMHIDELSWENIIDIANRGEVEQYLKVGDEKKLLLSTGEEVTMVVLGFGHDDLTDGSGKANVTFGMKDLLSVRYKMHGSDSATLSYSETDMHRSTLPNLYNMFPTEVKSGIKNVLKETKTATGVETIDCKLFLFSKSEVGAGTADTGSKYAYYSQWDSTPDVPLKKLVPGSSDSDTWWLRTVSSKSYYYGIGWNTEGKSTIVGWEQTSTKRICFGFCI